MLSCVCDASLTQFCSCVSIFLFLIKVTLKTHTLFCSDDHINIIIGASHLRGSKFYNCFYPYLWVYVQMPEFANWFSMALLRVGSLFPF